MMMNCFIDVHKCSNMTVCCTEITMSKGPRPKLKVFKTESRPAAGQKVFRMGLKLKDFRPENWTETETGGLQNRIKTKIEDF